MGEKVYGLIGGSLGHSYSVEIHREFGNAAYRLIELEPDDLAGFLRRPDLGGLNVTIPYKRDVMRYCDLLSKRAREIGSVNTIFRQPDGRLVGCNTDACGLEFMIRRAGIELAGKKTVIFGSGGASRTARVVAGELGAKPVVVISRTGADNYQNLSRHHDGRILINTTPLGMSPDTGAWPADPALFRNCEGVLDLIYNPRRTALLMRAGELGIPRAGGLPMLVAQARAAEELFTGSAIPDSENQRVLQRIYTETENIVLIGMPGCGKSAIGRELAQISGRPFVDTDEGIARRAGMTAEDIFRRHGEACFRRLEREEIAALAGARGCVMATGGGSVKDERNYAPLAQNGRIYHIERAVGALPRDGRPLSSGADLSALYAQRLPLYTRFRDVIVENDNTPRDAALRIWRDFCENIGD